MKKIFKLKADEIEIIRGCLQGVVNFYAAEIRKGAEISALELAEVANLTEILNRIKQWQDADKTGK